MKPSCGRIVHYTLTADDCARISARRITTVPQTQGNTPREGDVVPLIIVRVWPGDLVNGQGILDGEDGLWKTSIAEGSGPGTWAWPARV